MEGLKLGGYKNIFVKVLPVGGPSLYICIQSILLSSLIGGNRKRSMAQKSAF